MRRLALAACVISACSSSPYNGPRYGVVTVGESDDGGSPTANATATFSVEPPLGEPQVTDGPCTLLGTAPTDGYGAGEIDFTGTTSPVTLIEQGSAPAVMYAASGTVPDPVFVPGMQLTAMATGDQVPAFTVSAIGPMPLAGWTPPISLSRSGYAVTWTAGGAGSNQQIQLIILADESGTQNAAAAILCMLDDNGSFTIPASTFALVPAADNEAFLAIGRVAITTVTAGEVSIEFRASINNLNGPFTLGP